MEQVTLILEKCFAQITLLFQIRLPCYPDTYAPIKGVRFFNITRPFLVGLRTWNIVFVTEVVKIRNIIVTPYDTQI